eukprot:2214328-Pyramimonas_sp.AAC.1
MASNNSLYFTRHKRRLNSEAEGAELPAATWSAAIRSTGGHPEHAETDPAAPPIMDQFRDRPYWISMHGEKVPLQK